MTPCYTTCWDLITQRAEVFRYLPQDHGVAILIDVKAVLPVETTSQLGVRSDGTALPGTGVVT